MTDEYMTDCCAMAESILRGFESSGAVQATYETDDPYTAGVVADCIWDIVGDDDGFTYEVDSIGRNVRIQLAGWSEDE